MHRITIAICFTLMASVPNVSFAGFRCANGKLAQEGDSKSEVRLACGRPIFTESIGYEKIRGKYVRVDRWTYDVGEGSLLKLLDFHDGILAEINSGARQ